MWKSVTLEESQEQPSEQEYGDSDVKREYEVETIVIRRQKGNIQKPTRYVGCANSCNIGSIAYRLAIWKDIDTDKPWSYEEVVGSKEAKNWLMTIHEELKLLEKNETWVLVSLTEWAKPVWCNWVFKKKEFFELNQQGSKRDWWQKVSSKGRNRISKCILHLLWSKKRCDSTGYGECPWCGAWST